MINIALNFRKETPAADQLHSVARSSVSDAIVDQIIDLISRRVLRPGDRLPSERELCRRFDVGRSSVREALRSLSVMGVLDGRVGDGTFVSDDDRYLERTLQLGGMLLDPKRVEDLIETRLMLESHTAYWAASRATADNLAAMDKPLEGMAATLEDPEHFLAHDLRFHLEVARATQNTILSSLVTMTRRYLQEWIRGSLEAASAEEERVEIAEPDASAGIQDSRRARASLSLQQHTEILASLKRSDGPAAREAMAAHILSSSEGLRSRS